MAEKWRTSPQLTNCSTAIAIAIEVAVARMFQETLKYDYGIRKAYEQRVTFHGGADFFCWPSSLESLRHSFGCFLAKRFPRTGFNCHTLRNHNYIEKCASQPAEMATMQMQPLQQIITTDCGQQGPSPPILFHPSNKMRHLQL